jgi:3-hydroxyisobutyrate dehydrogenase-like beta-hydroxyacid dehydrogenase
MKIAIIGTGALGGTIAKKLTTVGYKVKVTDTSPIKCTRRNSF